MAINSFVRKVQQSIREGDYDLSFIEADEYEFLNDGAYAQVYKLNRDEVIRILDSSEFTYETEIEDYIKLMENPQSNVVKIHKVIPFDTANMFTVVMEYLDPIEKHYDITKDGFDEYMYGYYGSALVKTKGDYEQSLDILIKKIWELIDFYQSKIDDDTIERKSKEDVEKYIYRASPVKDIMYQI